VAPGTAVAPASSTVDCRVLTSFTVPGFDRLGPFRYFPQHQDGQSPILGAAARAPADALVAIFALLGLPEIHALLCPDADRDPVGRPRHPPRKRSRKPNAAANDRGSKK
jgi:hypothetical protein